VAIRRLLTTVIAVVLAAGVMLGATPAARADQGGVVLELPRHRQGYYLTLGNYMLITQNREDGFDLGTWVGSAFSIRLGQMVTRRLGLGLQIDFGSASKGPENAAITGLSLAGQLEIVRNVALHGGVGLGVVQLTDNRDPDEELRGAVGSGYFLGVSYDWFPFKRRLTGGFAVSPMAQARIIPGSDVTSLVFMVGVDLTWWTGLPNNQLELPTAEAFKKQQQ
jgi:hypothetical protein